MPRRQPIDDEDLEDLEDDDPMKAAAARFADILLEDPRAHSVLTQAQEGIYQFQSLLDKLGEAIERGPRRRKRAQPRRVRSSSRSRPRQAPPLPETDPRHPRQKLARTRLGLPLSGPLTKAQIIKQRRALAKIHHPDRPGGSAEAMQVVNNCADYLLSLYTRDT